MDMEDPTPQMAKLYFVNDGKEPSKTWGECKKALERWAKEKEVEAEQVKAFFKKQAVDVIWLSNKLEGTLPQGTDESKAKKVLSKGYDVDMSMSDLLGGDEKPSGRQLAQHLKAFKLLCVKREGSDSLPVLSEELILQAHHVMMQGLKTEQGEIVNAGVYRKISVHAGQHVYPSYQCIPENMEKIIKVYNQKVSQTHDMYQLASWLHFTVVSLHPFEDGNGRISRLLWCYSLMRDGLPFPVILTSGHKRSQSHLVQCLQRDRKHMVSNHPHLTTLTIVSVMQAWNDYSSAVVPTVSSACNCL